MKFVAPLVRATLVRRYKRFLADVALEGGEVVTAHCPNSGSMLSVDAVGAEVWLSPAAGAKRKLAYTWELIRLGEELVGINTGRPNPLVAEAIVAAAIPELVGYDRIRREVRYGRNSRIDLLLEAPDRPTCLVEVKNVTMNRQPSRRIVEFPDCVTARGTKHLNELADAAAAGRRAVMLFLAQRSDADGFVIADDLDPGYAAALERATDAGVETLFYRCAVNTDEIRLNRPMTFRGRSSAIGRFSALDSRSFPVAGCSHE